VALLLKNLLFTVLVPGTVGVYLPLWLAAGRPAAGGLLRAAAVVLFAAGGALYAWCVWDFARLGRGTPAPVDAPVRLVARGPYRWSRNPMYVGVLTLIAGQALLFRSPRLVLYGIGIGLIFHTFVVAYEEPHLAQTFGEDYARYRAAVGRWLPRPGGPRG